MELLETPFRGTSWAVSDLLHSAWEDGAGTHLQSAKPTGAQSVRVAPRNCSLCLCSQALPGLCDPPSAGQQPEQCGFQSDGRNYLRGNILGGFASHPVSQGFANKPTDSRFLASEASSWVNRLFPGWFPV